MQGSPRKATWRAKSESDIPGTRAQDVAEVLESDSVKAVRKKFGIDPVEPLLQDHACAIQGPILLQGRMYIFPHHVCFWSNIFGYVTKEVIALRDIREINKKWTALIFDNSIEIVTPERVYTFTSFVYRNKVYDLLFQCWRSTLLEGEDGGAGARDSVALGAPLSPGASGVRGPAAGLPGTPVAAAPPGSPAFSPASLPRVTFEEPPGTPSADPDAAAASSLAVVESVINVLRMPMTSATMSAQRPPYLQELLKMQLPLNIGEVFSVLFDDSSEFTSKTLYANGHSDIAIGPWQAAPENGLTRSSVYKAPVTEAFMSGGTTLVHTTERFALAADDSCALVEMTTATPEVAYSSYFSLSIRYEFLPVAPRCVSVTVLAGVLWEKTSQLRSIIERTAVKKLQKAYSVWADVVLAHVAQHDQTQRSKTFLNRTYTEHEAAHKAADAPPEQSLSPLRVATPLPMRFHFARAASTAAVRVTTGRDWRLGQRAWLLVAVALLAFGFLCGASLSGGSDDVAATPATVSVGEPCQADLAALAAVLSASVDVPGAASGMAQASVALADDDPARTALHEAASALLSATATAERDMQAANAAAHSLAALCNDERTAALLAAMPGAACAFGEEVTAIAALRTALAQVVQVRASLTPLLA